MEDTFDCIIVGGGIAGLSAAMVLARNDTQFLLIERGEFSGSKNVSGGVLWGRDLARLVPEYRTDDTAAFERFITHRRLTLMDETSAFTLDYKSDAYAEPPYMGVSILRSRFDRWLADRVEEAIANSAHPYGSFLATNVRVDEVLQDESGRATGIRAGDETFHADSVMIAEGELIRCFGLTESAHGLRFGVVRGHLRHPRPHPGPRDHRHPGLQAARQSRRERRGGSDEGARGGDGGMMIW